MLALGIVTLDRAERGRGGEGAHPVLRDDRQNAPASGVPTGLPSYSTVVFVKQRPYTMYE